MRSRTLVIPIALLSLVAACSTSSTPVDETTAPPPTTATSEAAPTTEAAAPTTDTAGPTTPAGGSSSSPKPVALDGTIGPDAAFTIFLKDDKGAAVSTLKAGKYNLKITDQSTIHNFHLSGPGVDLKTTVPELKNTTWPVDLKAGTYTYECDPHPNMKHTFTVS